MKTMPCIRLRLLVSLLCAIALQRGVPAHAATTINTTNHYAWGANFGWIEGCGDDANGLVIGEYVCCGSVYSANCGWISFGSGAPLNGIAYQNKSAGDFGVNVDSLGRLRGYAYGANIGWINFEDTGAPAVDLRTGSLSGYAYSANCGWICLSNAQAYVQTDTIRQGVLAPNGLPVAWLLANFGSTNVNAGVDADDDGVLNAQEYLAGTNPKDGNDYLRITGLTGNPEFTTVMLQWTANPARYYYLQRSTNLVATPLADWVTMPIAGWDSHSFGEDNSNAFYRVRAFRPLMP